MAYNDDAFETPQASVPVWIGLIVVAALSFWIQAVVTEERFVPSLNVIATRFRIPDDVAGATLMATGASSPELLTSAVSLFVTHSSLGLGTIVGSEIFNHLIICAGSILAARNHRLKLDRVSILRDIVFYALSLIFLLVALSDRRTVDEDNGETHIFISFWDSALLVGCYIAYVLVCANFERLVARFRTTTEPGVDKSPFPFIGSESYVGDEGHENPIVVPAMPFIHLLSREPSTNFRSDDSTDEHDVSVAELYRSKHSPTRGNEPPSPIRSFVVNKKQPKPSTIYGLEEMVWSEDGSISCFLWQRSSFYSKAKVAMNAWQLRWFTFHPDRVESLPDRTYQKKPADYPPFSQIEVCERNLLLKVHPCGAEQDKVFIFMAPSAEILRTAVEGLRRTIQIHTGEGPSLEALSAISAVASFGQVEDGPSLIAYPYGASLFQQALHVVLFPIKLLMHLSIPDARHLTSDKSEASLPRAFCATISCVGWIVISSIAMVTSLERLGALMRIPDSIMGITVSAAGTSLPNYVASQVAARQGLGNQAVSNALGSNIFNILVGLGLPWFLYTGIVLHGGEHGDLRDCQITESVAILAVVLLLFVILLFWNDFILSRWHAYMFIGLYVLYLVYAIGGVFI